GYHTLDTVMQSIGLQDKLTLSLNESSCVCITCSDESLCGEQNLAYRAATVFLDAIGKLGQGVAIHIEKQIPLAAGLGGGSADAAAVLMGLNHLFGEPLSLEALKELALPLGADVPFCLVGGTCRATGIGECLTPLAVEPSGWLVLTKPCQKESTGAMYQKYDEIKGLQDEKSCAIINEIGSNEWTTFCKELHNDFLSLYEQEQIHAAVEMFKQSGTIGSGLSGSGPTVFGIFADLKKAEVCAIQMKELYGWSCLTTFVSSGFMLLEP
ncbi:MAG: 4-(cytidine 5'-diphospho)-2-C-methyl-D-erythritol kinase, partial [Clostridia bacterium]|nr:4-(cytidine 5'-diphospho)-2-C-methyl-D-erythritol kinase [Clostridia bacterium]